MKELKLWNFLGTMERSIEQETEETTVFPISDAGCIFGGMSLMFSRAGLDL
jgi:hypothetical protein